MTAFAPRSLLPAAAVIVAALVLAFLVTRIRGPRTARGAAWLVVFLAVGAAHVVTIGEPPGFRMLTLIGALLFAMKGVVAAEARARDGTRLPWPRFLAFAVLWPGMRPETFARFGRPRAGAAALMARGLACLAAGVLLLLAARFAWNELGSRFGATALLLVGLSLILHFGIFQMLAGAWRAAGADAQPLFRAPLRSRGLAEFWGRRWTVAFAEMTSAAVYRPVSGVAGRPAGLLAAFALSGIFHEIAISLPVGAGIGGPFLFFALHGLMTVAERRRGIPIGRPATIAALVLPVPLLFHRPFLEAVVWPLLGAS